MTETYWRFHWADCPEFSADNAWSALWGATRSADGTQVQCMQCGGTGQYPHTVTCPKCRGYEDDCRRCDGTGYIDVDDCMDCDGTGWQDCSRGYSACHTAEGLVDYFRQRGMDADPGPGQVIVFEGTLAGNGFDGEPLVVPTRVVATMTWAELLAHVQGQPFPARP